MAEYYLITENFMSNNSALITNDRSEYFCDLGSPQTSVAKDIVVTEESSIKFTRDFHFIGEIVCSKAISKIIAKFNPYKCLYLPAEVSDKQGLKGDFTLLSLENIQACADMGKSDITDNPFRSGHKFINSIYLDFNFLSALPKYKRQLFIIEETPDRIIVSKELGEALIAYRETVANSSLSIRPVSDDGRVPEIY
ncbi:hypothetical protein HWV01_07720 [Moritella sp. 5]|uniref:hypothetical protein n=1 Tax=Moritella sp. 5 TaxID=2746231 RepID=UPI001BA83A4F|nr:hypothetical protein [Moritella sp. 5]QUM80178.1 hypothetical protein HWV01_07720 [Moritella sp. 5]